MKRGRAWALALLMIVGLTMWAAGTLNVFAASPLLSLGVLVAGGIQAVAGGYLLLNSRPSGRLDHCFGEVSWFCGSCGAGLAFIGLALSPLTHWGFPALVFAVGGLALILWAPQAFTPAR